MNLRWVVLFPVSGDVWRADLKWSRMTKIKCIKNKCKPRVKKCYGCFFLSKGSICMQVDICIRLKRISRIRCHGIVSEHENSITMAQCLSSIPCFWQVMKVNLSVWQHDTTTSRSTSCSFFVDIPNGNGSHRRDRYQHDHHQRHMNLAGTPWL